MRSLSQSKREPQLSRPEYERMAQSQRVVCEGLWVRLYPMATHQTTPGRRPLQDHPLNSQKEVDNVKNPIKPNGIHNYWMERFGCTRNQARRIIHDVRHNTDLDGPWGEYQERSKALKEAGLQ